mmetsp:Transcript_39113/g.81845  ORF Transcript_39113/g.81845 Transcript_39113/m.81845 type:complete len:184 (+) Transcript_39113:117-668(+)
MTTRTYPIFRSVQRAIGGSVGKHKPAFAPTTQIQVKEEEIINEETEKRINEPHLPDGYWFCAAEQDDDVGLVIEKKSTWPINSEAARQMRREFAQEGFRRLYNVALGQTTFGQMMHAVGGDDDGFRNNNENEGGDGQRNANDDREGIIAQLLTQPTAAEPNAIEEDETPLVLNGNEDWVHYAQ